MKIRGNKIYIALFIIFVSVFTISSIKIGINKTNFKRDIEYYLYNEKLYKQKDIKQIEVAYYFYRLIFSYEPYVVSVVFFDEPDTIYYYSSTGSDINNGTIKYKSSMGGYTAGTKH